MSTTHEDKVPFTGPETDDWSDPTLHSVDPMTDTAKIPRQPAGETSTETGDLTEVITPGGRNFVGSIPEHENQSDSLLVDTPAGSIEPSPPDRRVGRARRRIVAIGAGAAVFLGGGVAIGIAVASNGDTKPKDSTSTGVVPGQVNQNSPSSKGGPQIPSNFPNQSSAPARGGPVIPDFPSNTPAESANNNGLYPNTLGGSVTEAGNIALHSTLPGTPTITYEWNGKEWSVPELVLPGATIAGHTYTTDDLGRQVLANYAALMSLKPGSEAFNRVLNNITNSVLVKKYLINDNQAFQSERSGDPPYSNQDIIYDTATNPITFASQGPDKYGDVDVLYASGDLDSRPLSVSSSLVQQDPNAYVPDSSQLLKNLRFGYNNVSNNTVKLGVFGVTMLG